MTIISKRVYVIPIYFSTARILQYFFSYFCALGDNLLVRLCDAKGDYIKYQVMVVAIVENVRSCCYYEVLSSETQALYKRAQLKFQYLFRLIFPKQLSKTITRRLVQVSFTARTRFSYNYELRNVFLCFSFEN